MDFLLLLFLIFISFNIAKNQDVANQTLSIKVTNSLQCILIFFVMFHHLNQGLRGSPGAMLSTGLSIAGRLCVGLFFFLSGYGLIKQFMTKGQTYLDNFIKKRFFPVLVSFFIAFCIYFNTISTIDLKTAIHNLLLGSPVVSNGWYGTAILVFYLLFYISGRISKESTGMIICLFIGTFIILFLERKFYYGEWTYNALLCFPIGALWAYKEQEITNTLFKRYKISTALSAILFSSFFYLDEIRPMLVFRMASCIFFSITIILLSYKFVVESPIFSTIKSCLFEIYLYHGLFISLLYNKLNSRFLYCLLVIGASILFSCCLKRAENYIASAFKIKKHVQISKIND